ncbi:MAG: tRNA (adenosine(37)-N6)-dimethylallyltransferase MiaA [Candidatus Omnitrophica bacterium]|nr:tRNA (adenosine(37)-N6)-dimethylallyltransferase MiaA [Candidatus Omnitrophota bacterium]
MVDPVKEKVVFVIGPTAVGKTEVSVKLAEEFSGEIISCDSMQVYKGMEISSQAPSITEQRKIPHHLIGILSPTEEYSVADFRERAQAIIDEIHKRKKIPFVIGGSGLYIKALLDGLCSAPSADWRIRRRLQRDVEAQGEGALFERLKDVDPETALKVHPNDTRRIIRALEVYELTRLPLSKHKEKTEGIFEKYDIRLIGLGMPRPKLYKRIEERVEEMFGKGLAEEVARLKSIKLSLTARSALGYKEITGFLEGEYDLERAKYLLKRNTRRFAKRQLGWFRPDKRITWIEADGPEVLELTKSVIK